MKFNNEAELQDFIHSVIGGQKEVTFSDDSRIDILTGAYAIEVKPKLTRAALLQAIGQSAIYKQHCPRQQSVIAGITPSDVNSSYATADRARKLGIEVWYVDQMPQFQSAYNGTTGEAGQGSPSLLWSLVALVVANWYWIVIGLFVWAISSGGDSPPKKPTPAPKGYTNLYKEPSATSPLAAVLKNGTSLTAELCQGDWVRTDRGWVEKSKLSDEVCN